ncbi:MAG: FHA domain-containing protein [Myxococcota bacterium]
MNAETVTHTSQRDRYPRTASPFGPVALTDAAIELAGEQLRASRGSGYFEIDLGEQIARILVYEGTLHSGYLEGCDGAKRVALSVLFARLRGKASAEIAFFECPKPMLLLLAVCLQNPPTQIVSGVDLNLLLDELAQQGRNVVLHLRRGCEHALVYCRDGGPRAGFFPEPIPGDTVVDQMAEFIALAPASSRIHVIDQLDSRCDVHGEIPIDELWRGRIGPPAYFIEVTRGGTVVSRRVFEAVEVTIGRDLRNDVVLEFPSVSRHHCKVSWTAGSFYLSDLDSGSGTFLRGERVSRERLEYDDVFTLGDCGVRFSRDATGDAVKHELRTMFIDAEPDTGPVPGLAVDGELHRIAKRVFTLGKSASADLLVRGWFVRDIQATIVGAARPLRIIPTAGGRKVRVNGVELPKEGQPLKSGDSIEIAGTRMTYVETAAD